MNLAIRSPTLRVRIQTEGALAILGHNRVFDQPVTITVTPGAAGLDGAQVNAEGDLRRTEVLGDISAGDRKEMLARKDNEMFETGKHPKLAFAGAYDAGGRVLAGTLTLHGVARPVSIPLQVREQDFGWSVAGEIALDLRPFGIKPYKALLGAIRVAPEVAVSVSAEVVRG